MSDLSRYKGRDENSFTIKEIINELIDDMVIFAKDDEITYERLLEAVENKQEVIHTESNIITIDYDNEGAYGMTLYECNAKAYSSRDIQEEYMREAV